VLVHSTSVVEVRAKDGSMDDGHFSTLILGFASFLCTCSTLCVHGYQVDAPTLSDEQ